MIFPNIIESSMRVAFGGGAPNRDNPADKLISMAYAKGIGLHRPKQMWNASVSYRTYQSLKNQGVLA